MRFGLQNETIDQIRSVFARHPEVRQVILYGSRAMGTQRDGSDIDLTLTGKALNLKVLTRIETELDDLLLPHKLDLSIRRQIDNDSLLNHIERVGVLFYDRECRSAADYSGSAMKDGWETKTLGQLCQLISGRHIDAKDYNTGSRGIGYLTGPSDFGSVYPIVTKWTEHPIITAKAGDILITVKGSGVGRINLLDHDEVAISRQLMAVRVNAADSRFILAYLISIFDHFQSVSTGAAIPGLSREQILELQIELPPLAEQQRIVGILDEAFEGIATAKANAEKNLQNARALFESHLQSVFTQRGEGWVATRLEDVCGFQNGFAFKSSTFKPSGVPIIRISNIQDGRVDIDNRLVFFDPKDYRENLDRYRIVEDDLLIAMSGATTGKLGFNTDSTVFYLNQRVGKFEPGKKLNKRFLYHFLSTKVEENLRISTGAAQPNLSTEQIKGFVLPLPSVDEQQRIVEALETLSEETQRLATIYERKLAAQDDLKKSLLHQAFSGEL